MHVYGWWDVPKGKSTTKTFVDLLHNHCVDKDRIYLILMDNKIGEEGNAYLILSNDIIPLSHR